MSESELPRCQTWLIDIREQSGLEGKMNLPLTPCPWCGSTRPHRDRLEYEYQESPSSLDLPDVTDDEMRLRCDLVDAAFREGWIHSLGREFGLMFGEYEEDLIPAEFAGQIADQLDQIASVTRVAIQPDPRTGLNPGDPYPPDLQAEIHEMARFIRDAGSHGYGTWVIL